MGETVFCDGSCQPYGCELDEDDAGRDYAGLEPIGRTVSAVLGAVDRRRRARVRLLAAELALLEDFDNRRRYAGHDYGSGQRGAELSRRRRELDELGYLDELGPTRDEMVAAFERVGRPRYLRVVQGRNRYGITRASSRSEQIWRTVAHVYGARI